MEFCKFSRSLGASIIAILTASPPICLGADASTAAGAITSAGDAIKIGDHVTVLSDAPIFYRLNASNDKIWYCAPENSRFTVNAIDANKTATDVSAPPAAAGAAAAVPAPTAAAAPAAPAAVEAKVTSAGGKSTTVVQGAATVTQSTDSSLYVNFAGKPTDDVFAEYLSPVNWYRDLSPDVKNGGRCQPANNPEKYQDLLAGAYEVNGTDLQKYGLQRRGFTWGGLVVPYKFEFHDRTFQAVPSVVGYVGYEGWWSGVSLANIVALGGGAVASSSATAATTQTSTTSASPTTSSGSKATYTAAIGEIATFGGSYKVGVLVGWDWQGTGSGFRYEGKPWIAISAGF